jgi:integrase
MSRIPAMLFDVWDRSSVCAPLVENIFHRTLDNRKSSGSGLRDAYSPAHTSTGKLPYWPGSLYKAHLQPAAKEIGIVGHFGWHTFRHTYATLLKGNGEDVKVVQKLVRHANIPVTLSV